MPAAHPADKMAHVSDEDVGQVMGITALGEEHREIIMNALRGRDPVVVINEYYNDPDKVCPSKSPHCRRAARVWLTDNLLVSQDVLIS